MQQQEGSSPTADEKETGTEASHKTIRVEASLTPQSTPETSGFLGKARTDHPRMFHFFSLPDFPGSALHM
ncbi:hypothetical protein ACNPM8_01660 [Glutamicibacter sp. AGC46]